LAAHDGVLTDRRQRFGFPLGVQSLPPKARQRKGRDSRFVVPAIPGVAMVCARPTRLADIPPNPCIKIAPQGLSRERGMTSIPSAMLLGVRFAVIDFV